ncbi:hypothetical protein GC088_14750 [Arthrobacter sp. JZ12]|uniref:MarR family winged helix-turn-helix transcriptional regulator n=1 Tax=Arthrobacter sp. JZ12 TaxID=2654190 RepID=UPI002B45B706|nr:hypothetical protein [Arthrobacter sp. JZ12]WRH26202.1 hypothetical protein GC088_14750 [Arthrobacter sp. JZ12]
MASPLDPTASSHSVSAAHLVPGVQTPGNAPVDTQSTRLMLTTAAHFIQQHLESELAGLGLTPLGLSVLSGLAELPGASAPALASQCLLSVPTTEGTLAELEVPGFVAAAAGEYSLTGAGRAVLTEARKLEDDLFAEKSTTLRLELSALISRLRDGGVLDAK